MFSQRHSYHLTRNIVCPIHFTITFAGQTNVDHYTVNIVIPEIIKPGFHCMWFNVVLFNPGKMLTPENGLRSSNSRQYWYSASEACAKVTSLLRVSPATTWTYSSGG